eukprot:Gregarina_sp_Poly_1__9511@NODE_598_length_7261_cov_191_713789_g415_i1_p3_GENE_NODE_598_length_7261_cov_191_713789_g415_i1NODE_598_length_7261_cov_191_713789_g415_i1_p3_ORF_typecomplete_len376_score55_09_NODE_598_length_7261_cov_191_713789_g415_i115732700
MRLRCFLGLYGLGNHAAATVSRVSTSVQEVPMTKNVRELAARNVLLWSYYTTLDNNLALALNSLLVAHKAIEKKQGRLVRAARELLNQIWMDGHDISELADRQQALVGLALPISPQPQMEVLRIDKAKIEKVENLAPGDQKNLVCPVDCDLRYCANKGSHSVQCFKPRSSADLDRAELSTDLDLGVECAPFKNPDTQECPNGFARCSEGYPYHDNHVVVEAAEDPQPVVLRGVNLSSCSRLLVLPEGSECKAKSPADYANLMTLSQKAVGAMGGHVIRPVLMRGSNFEMLAMFAPKVPVGFYGLCYIEFQPGISIQTADDRQSALRARSQSEFETLVLKAAAAGDLRVLPRQPKRQAGRSPEAEEEHPSPPDTQS